MRKPFQRVSLIVGLVLTVPTQPQVGAADILVEEPAKEAATESEAGFESIFDGKTLDGWDGNPELWSVRDGCILGVTTDESPIKTNQFIIWKDEVSNFVLRLEFRIADRGNGNSGIQYRSQRVPGADQWAVKGYQADIERTNKYMGILYDEGGRGILAMRGEKVIVKPKAPSNKKKGANREIVGSLGDPDEIVRDVKPEQWNTYEIIAEGNVLVHKINGRETIHVTDNDAEYAEKRGILALQLHRGPGMQIEFRNIRVQHLPKSK